MSDDRTAITKLAMDGSNWVTDQDCMNWLFKSRLWSDHLTSTTITQPYLNAGDVNGQTPPQRWAAEEAAANNMIATSVPRLCLHLYQGQDYHYGSLGHCERHCYDK